MLKSSTSKNESNTKVNIKSKTNENTELIHELKELRVHKNKLENQLEAMKLTHQKLKMEIDRRNEESKKVLAQGGGQHISSERSGSHG